MQTATPGVRTGAEEVSSQQIPRLLGGGGAEGAEGAEGVGIRTKDSEAGLQAGDQSQVSETF